MVMSVASNESSTHWNPEVLENRVFMLIPVAYNSASQLDKKASKQLEECIRKQVMPVPVDQFSKAMQTRFPEMGVARGKHLWADLAGDSTEDFHPFIRQIASVQKEIRNNAIRFAHPLQMAQEDLISQIKGGKPRRFRLKLGQNAAKRCGKEMLCFQFLAPSLYCFASGVAILVVEWQYLDSNGGPVYASDVIEGNYAISHPARGEHKSAFATGSASDEIVLSAESFIELAKSLLPAELSDKLTAGRRVLYTALRVAPHETGEGENDMALLAHRLCHRQTFDYRPNPAQLETGQLRPFANVRHAAAIEGGCTLIEADNSAPESLRCIVRDRVRNTYLPLALVSFHAYFWLLSQTQVLPESSAAEDLHSEKEDLENLQARILNFRRIFHFPVASQISQHNEFHALWQSTLMIDRQLSMLAELSESVSHMVQEKRVKLFGYLSGGIGGLLLGRELAEIVRDKAVTNLYEWQRMMLEAQTHMSGELMASIDATVHTAELWEWITFGGALGGFAAGIFLAWRYGLKGGHH